MKVNVEGKYLKQSDRNNLEKNIFCETQILLEES